MSRLPSTLLVVGLIVLAGCTGGPPAGSETATQTQTPATITHDGPTTSTSPTPTTNESRVVDFDELNADQQAAFRDALDGTVAFVPNSSYVAADEGYPSDQAGPFRDTDYVRYEGELYRIDIDYGAGELYASYGISAELGVPSDSETVTNFTDLPADLRDEVRTALVEGDYYAPSGKWDSLPQPLGDTDYVRYENETYRMEYVVGDQWADLMTVERVD
ncbi:hypothetical protein SAMN04487949_3167 [Halogranum gelatinilyticum]|uniref:DUF7979 domain-containing protein n=1 Tax=Halogranum gelatinilyticum TaxID=660521 RepID=A0A1G9XXB6_9EURY|nr:hypothetical protein [Halogranum gelatinilyticum]SDN01418.1 hypothetical protein SAMN04487949_3167 [Halogranum gelatinilyticum]